MTDTSVVFNVIGKDTGVGNTLGRIRSLFRSTGTEGAAAMEIVDHQVNKLDHDIKDAKDSLSKLAREFAMASAGAERLQISRAMSRQSSELGRLTKARNLIDIPDADIANTGKSIGGKLVASITDGLGNLGPVTAAMGAAALGASPFIGATIAGAVVGAAGIGGVVGGVLLAAKDSRVQAAWTQMGDFAKSQLEHVAEPFVPATLDAIRIVRGGFTDLLPTIKGIFDSTAGYLGPLTQGVVGFVQQAAAGFAKAAAAAGPVIRVISDQLPALGAQLGDLFETMAQHADEGAVAIAGIFNIINFGIGSVTTLVDWLSKAFTLAHNLGLDSVLGFFMPFKEGQKDIAKATTSTLGFNEAVDDTGEKAGTAADKIKSMQSALDEFTDSNLSAYDATTRARQAIADTTDTISKNGRTLNANTEKGRANRDALVALARSFNGVTTANEKANVSGATSSRIYTNQRAAFIKAATGAGLAKDKASDLADQLLKLPRSKNIDINADKSDAAADIKAVKSALAALRNKTIYITARYNKVNNQLGGGGGYLGERAAGGPVARGVPYLVGEEGPELIVPDNNGTVLTAGKTRAALTGGARTSNSVPSTMNYRGGMGGGGGTLQLQVVGERKVAELVRYLIRTYNLIDGAIT